MARAASIVLYPVYAGLPPHHAAYARASPNITRATLEGAFTAVKAEVARAGFDTGDYEVMCISATVMPDIQSGRSFDVVLLDRRHASHTDRTTIPMCDDPNEPGSVNHLLSKVWDAGYLAHIQVTFTKMPR